MAIKTNPESAWTFHHDQTWDYFCRNCLRNSETILMKVYSNPSGIWVECPKCGTKENIAIPPEIVMATMAPAMSPTPLILMALKPIKNCNMPKWVRFITWLFRRKCPYRLKNECKFWFGICTCEGKSAVNRQ